MRELECKIRSHTRVGEAEKHNTAHERRDSHDQSPLAQFREAANRGRLGAGVQGKGPPRWKRGVHTHEVYGAPGRPRSARWGQPLGKRWGTTRPEHGGHNARYMHTHKMS